MLRLDRRYLEATGRSRTRAAIHPAKGAKQLDRRPSGTWTVECVAVAEQARGLGVGKALMRHIIEEARAAGVDSVGISVTLGNDIAERLYLSAGFQPCITCFPEYYRGQFPGTKKFRLSLGRGLSSAP
jgi:ribosomal protein S18 acetylase RimI-like enzyme